ncbi:hypothetical protein [Kroppenstedtia sanguinis]|uniref:Uncharacterized protein n=1 Tax=Kroppenstedtia sanguinis TaxID=1380684 RepID=A0ABW4C5X0_9BACL
MQKYDRTYQIEGTTVHIVAPRITEEEKEKRLDEVQRVIQKIWNDLELHQT